MLDYDKLDRRAKQAQHIVDSCDTIHDQLDELSIEMTAAEKIQKKLIRIDKMMVGGSVIITILMALHIFG